jgi:Uma2 family endonuclease
MSAPPSNPFRRFSVAEYHRMIQAGILTDEDKVELLDGYLVLKMPRNPPHDVSVSITHDALRAIVPAGWCIRGQSAITLSTSEPEPDIVLARGALRDYSTHHPEPAEIGLVVEVADTTLLRDRNDKGEIYATAGLPEYWIINLVDRQIEVYTQPSTPGTVSTYTMRRDYRIGDAVPLSLDGMIVGHIAVRDTLP